MGVQALGPEAPVEGLDERIVRRLARPREVENDAVPIGPQVEIAGDELRALVHPNSLRIADPRTGLIEGVHHVLAAIAEPRIEYRREPGECIDHSENADLPAGRELVVNEVHRPRLVGLRRRLTISPQLCADLALGRLVAELKAQLIVNSMCLLDVDIPALALKHDMHAAVAIPNACRAYLLDAGFEAGLIGAARFVMVGGAVNLQGLAGPAD